MMRYRVRVILFGNWNEGGEASIIHPKLGISEMGRKALQEDNPRSRCRDTSLVLEAELVHSSCERVPRTLWLLLHLAGERGCMVYSFQYMKGWLLSYASPVLAPLH